MKRISTWAIVAAAMIALAASNGRAQESEDGKLDAFFKAELEQEFRQRPLEATRLGDHRFDALLDDISSKARDGWLALAQQTLADLPKQVDYRKLTRDGQIDFEILKHQLEARIWLT